MAKKTGGGDSERARLVVAQEAARIIVDQGVRDYRLAKQKAVELIKADLGQIDLVVYSLASPVRKMPDSGEVVRSVLKPIGQTYQSTAIDTNKDVIINAEIEPANGLPVMDLVIGAIMSF